MLQCVRAVAAGRSLARWSAERVILGGTALFGIGMSLWPLAGSLITGGLLIALAGVLTGPVLVATFTLRQQYAPPNLLAQVSATAASLKIGAFAIGSAIGGWLVPTVGVFYAVAIVAAMQLVAAGIGLIGGAGCTDRQSNRHYNPEGCAERQSA
jgi:predicted MFS family arabinose efflux permease